MIIYTDRASLSKWDARFLALAEQVAAWSKGPRKRIGAVFNDATKQFGFHS